MKWRESVVGISFILGFGIYEYFAITAFTNPFDWSIFSVLSIDAIVVGIIVAMFTAAVVAPED